MKQHVDSSTADKTGATLPKMCIWAGFIANRSVLFLLKNVGINRIYIKKNGKTK